MTTVWSEAVPAINATSLVESSTAGGPVCSTVSTRRKKLPPGLPIKRRARPQGTAGRSNPPSGVPIERWHSCAGARVASRRPSPRSVLATRKIPFASFYSRRNTGHINAAPKHLAAVAFGAVVRGLCDAVLLEPLGTGSWKIADQLTAMREDEVI